MTCKTTLAAVVLGLLPTFAMAYCDDMRRMEESANCPAGQIYNIEFEVCVFPPTG